MGQLTVYIEDSIRKKIETAAKKARSSVSEWVRVKLTEALKTSSSDDFIQTYGSLKETRLERPKQSSWGEDTPRSLHKL